MKATAAMATGAANCNARAIDARLRPFHQIVSSPSSGAIANMLGRTTHAHAAATPATTAAIQESASSNQIASVHQNVAGTSLIGCAAWKRKQATRLPPRRQTS